MASASASSTLEQMQSNSQHLTERINKFLSQPNKKSYIKKMVSVVNNVAKSTKAYLNKINNNERKYEELDELYMHRDQVNKLLQDSIKEMNTLSTRVNKLRLNLPKASKSDKFSTEEKLKLNQQLQKLDLLLKESIDNVSILTEEFSQIGTRILEINAESAESTAGGSRTNSNYRKNKTQNKKSKTHNKSKTSKLNKSKKTRKNRKH